MSIFKKFTFLVVLFLGSCAFSTQNVQKKNAYNLNSAFESVVKIAMEVKIDKHDGEVSGTAWAIDGDHLVTASHV